MTPHEIAGWLSERLDRIEEKVDAVKDHCAAIDVTLTKQAGDVAHHIKRTDTLEDRVEQVAAELKPISDHVRAIRIFGWLLGGVSVGASAWTYVKDLLP